LCIFVLSHHTLHLSPSLSSFSSTPSPGIYTLSLHDALPIFLRSKKLQHEHLHLSLKISLYFPHILVQHHLYEVLIQEYFYSFSYLSLLFLISKLLFFFYFRKIFCCTSKYQYFSRNIFRYSTICCNSVIFIYNSSRYNSCISSNSSSFFHRYSFKFIVTFFSSIHIIIISSYYSRGYKYKIPQI